PVADGLGVFHVISSYWGQFTISTTCCREMMPAPEFYRECLQSSFEELLASAATARKRKAS
ncbi:MAG: wax ester/triacylglycerol synthase family O-acyltransferase, partial [Geminicoccus sp.]|nr:wax ester/triacylglycerol synthase family O-acyltransferase [Geminicoccus sp.]